MAQTVVEETGMIRVTYCTCPSCGQRHYRRRQRSIDRPGDVPVSGHGVGPQGCLDPRHGHVAWCPSCGAQPEARA